MAVFPAVRLDGYWSSLSSIVLQWSASAGAAGYRVYVNGAPQSQVLSQRITYIIGLGLETDYTFNVVAVDGGGVDSSILSNPTYFRHGNNEVGTYQPRISVNTGIIPQGTPYLYLTTESGLVLTDEQGNPLVLQ